MRAFEGKYGAKILEGYGLSETSPVASFNRVERAKLGSIGTPIPGVEFKLVNDDGSETAVGEVGEICIRGHNVMKGYWNRAEATAEAIDPDGWFHSGDIGKVDDDGFYYIVDRKKELIIRGGFNVYPREIEEVLYEHPAVLEAAVIGLPHDTHGEEVGAAVSLQPGAELTPEALRDYVKARSRRTSTRAWSGSSRPAQGCRWKILKRASSCPCWLTDQRPSARSTSPTTATARSRSTGAHRMRQPRCPRVTDHCHRWEGCTLHPRSVATPIESPVHRS